ncbi:zinc finger protein [Atractiella rhizophila]|nr:zinc finger protein [Atractiella rhizophila]
MHCSNICLVLVFTNEYSWNGDAYECYLCHSEFRTLTSLNQHLASPRHADENYSCPACKKDFTTLSGLWQHCEAEKCGVQRFSKARKMMEQLLEGTRRLTI